MADAVQFLLLTAAFFLIILLQSRASFLEKKVEQLESDIKQLNKVMHDSSEIKGSVYYRRSVVGFGGQPH